VRRKPFRNRRCAGSSTNLNDSVATVRLEMSVQISSTQNPPPNTW
jgi:hypothetical protein